MAAGGDCFLIRAFDDRVFLFRCSRRHALKCRKAFRYKACDHVIQKLRSAIQMNDPTKSISALAAFNPDVDFTGIILTNLENASAITTKYSFS
jgi:hypothetical protein